MEYSDNYLPVDPDFIDKAQRLIELSKAGKVHYYDSKGQIELSDGTLINLIKDNFARYLEMANGEKIRLDKIITILGSPGPSFENYERFANACLSCESI
ncbi:MAG: hypothetical protein RIC35_24770 [Marinoscillum sp.]